MNDDLPQTSTYTANELNQYTAIANPDPGKQRISGQIKADAQLTVTQGSAGVPPVNLPVTRTGTGAIQSFTATAQAATTNAPAYVKVEIEGRPPTGSPHPNVLVRKEAGYYFPPQSEIPTYDHDGNLTRDGRWTYEWDAENRLRAQQTTDTAVLAGVPNQRIEYAYDSQSRRIRKAVKSFSPQTQTFEVTGDLRFLYDGWNLIAEVEFTTLQNSTTPTLRLAATHAWGLDLSGTETGAGGVGGLVFTKLYSSTAQPPFSNAQLSSTALLAPAYDGNGNVLAYVDLQTNSIAARYEYDPFGKKLMAEEQPTVAGRLPHQFSAKYHDGETGDLYYGYRIYRPDWGRWMNRDPNGEEGGLSLYCLVDNNPTNNIDVLGKNPGVLVGGGIGTCVCPGPGTAAGAAIGGGVVFVGPTSVFFGMRFLIAKNGARLLLSERLNDAVKKSGMNKCLVWSLLLQNNFSAKRRVRLRAGLSMAQTKH